jgi:hypothetical protein
MDISPKHFLEHYNKVKARGPNDPLYRLISRDMHPTEWALANGAELRRSVEQFIRGPRRLDGIFDPEWG